MTHDSHAEPGVVIVGAGQAGCETAFALRTAGYAGRIDLIGREPWAPYRRPPLSKQFVGNEAAAESLAIKPVPAYEKAGIHLHLGNEVRAIDRERRSVDLAGGEVLAYHSLVLATGGAARRLDIDGSGLQGIHTLRTVDDALLIRQRFHPGKRLVVVGGGFVGLEVAALAIQHGLHVTVLEAAPRLLSRVTSKQMSDFYADVHAAAGVRLVFDANVHGFDGEAGSVRAVRCADEVIAADLVLVGVGMQVADGLAAASGLATDQGVITDAYGRTEDAQVFAIGDCARSWREGAAHYLRIESVPNAIEQARVVAHLIAGKPAPEIHAPWFWSDQYDLKLQMVGLSGAHDTCVLRGRPEARAFMAFYLHDGRVVAADAINKVADFNVAKRLVGERRSVDPAVLADESLELKALVA